MPKRKNSVDSIIVAGAGYTGQRLLEALAGKSKKLVAITNLTRVDLPGVQSVHIDLDEENQEQIDVGKYSLVCYLIPPESDDDPESRIRRFVEKVMVDAPARILLISTTGVYGDCHGEWVDETRPLDPQTDRAKRRVAVENFCSSWAAEKGVSLAIFRVAGIYGPDRVPVERLRRGIVFPKYQTGGYSNRIHVDDLVSACTAGLFSEEEGVYNVSDGHPMQYQDYFNLVAETWGIEGVIETDEIEVQDPISPALRSYLRESRKIDNRKLLETFSLQLRYPHPRQGLMACR